MKLVQKILALVAVLPMGVAVFGGAEESVELVSQDELKGAVEKVLPVIQRTAASSERQRQCFTCHNGHVPLLAMEKARKRGLGVDREIMDTVFNKMYSDTFRLGRHHERGIRLPDEADGMGWSLFTFKELGWKGETRTKAGVKYLVDYQKDRGHWEWLRPRRMPTVGSVFTTNWISLEGVMAYGDQLGTPDAARRIALASGWIVENESKDTEDSVSRLKALHLIGKLAEAKKEGAKLIGLQRADGGWGQEPGMASDAYATGTALEALYRTGVLKFEDEVSQKGVRYLLRTQKPDGTWYVKKRAEPLQNLYDSEFPYGEDQFISAPATAWAMMALMEGLEIVSAGTYYQIAEGE